MNRLTRRWKLRQTAPALWYASLANEQGFIGGIYMIYETHDRDLAGLLMATYAVDRLGVPPDDEIEMLLYGPVPRDAWPDSLNIRDYIGRLLSKEELVEHDQIIERAVRSAFT